jgi:hypothetical protein
MEAPILVFYYFEPVPDVPPLVPLSPLLPLLDPVTPESSARFAGEAPREPSPPPLVPGGTPVVVMVGLTVFGISAVPLRVPGATVVRGALAPPSFVPEAVPWAKAGAAAKDRAAARVRTVVSDFLWVISGSRKTCSIPVVCPTTQSTPS